MYDFNFLKQVRERVSKSKKKVKSLEELAKQGDKARENGFNEEANKLDAEFFEKMEKERKVLTKLSEMLDNIQL